jgi:membrane protein DedA with SNARE-associated domain
MNASDFVRDYGYLAVVVGTFFEGEMVMLAAGVAASAGILTVPGVMLSGMIGIFASDTLCFLIGRLARHRVERWFPRLYARLGGVFRLIEQHDDKLIVYFQFFPGLCTVTPVAFGMTGISTERFLALDLLGNAFWTLVFSVGGYCFGSAFADFFHGADRWIAGVGAVIVVAGLAGWGLSRLVGKHLKQQTQ